MIIPGLEMRLCFLISMLLFIQDKTLVCLGNKRSSVDGLNVFESIHVYKGATQMIEMSLCFSSNSSLPTIFIIHCHRFSAYVPNPQYLLSTVYSIQLKPLRKWHYLSWSFLSTIESHPLFPRNCLSLLNPKSNRDILL